MNKGMLIRHCLISAASFLLSGPLSLMAKAEQGFLPKTQLRAPYSHDIAAVDRYKLSSMKSLIQTSSQTIPSNIRNQASSLQNKVGETLYKTLTSSKSKLQSQVAGAALMYGIESFGFGAPVKEGIRYIKEKTRYNFGDCGQVKLSTNKLQAKSCITNETSIKLKSNYNLDSVTLDFEWNL